MARLVSIVWYRILPALFGGQKGIAGFNEELAKHYDLVCLCSRNNEPGPGISYKTIPELPVTKWQFLMPACWRRIKRIAREHQATHIILEHPYHGIAGRRAARALGAKLILHAHNIESQRFMRMGKWWWRLLFIYEKWVMQKAYLILFKSVEEMQWGIRHYRVDPGSCMVLPYGIARATPPDRDEAKKIISRRHGIAPGRKILLFAATLDYPPNREAVKAIQAELVPRLGPDPGYHILVCGRGMKEAAAMAGIPLTIAGQVEDIEQYYGVADAVINPVQWGGGVQTKNTDALARHCNLVCFTSMADPELLAAAPGKIFPCPDGDWDGFVRQIASAVSREEPTPDLFFEQYSWEAIIDKLVQRIERG